MKKKDGDRYGHLECSPACDPICAFVCIIVCRMVLCPILHIKQRRVPVGNGLSDVPHLPITLWLW